MATHQIQFLLKGQTGRISAVHILSCIAPIDFAPIGVHSLDLIKCCY